MKIEFKNEFHRFNDHLEYRDNDRMIFSAPFGIGKTTFLKDYFSKRKDYEVFHLFPANYSVSESDNIFEYIKYDILYQIINKTEIEKEEFDHTLTFWSFISENGDKMVKPFIEGISYLNKPIAAMLKMALGYSKLGDEYLKYHEKVQQVDIEKINEFRDDEENKIGSIFERNFITHLIQFYLTEKLKSKDPGAIKKTILIIDDLDRIDPDHFFRILNIFAAHIDQDLSDLSLKNKFGFDQVLFVFDKDNARNIFHYRYGQNVDYDGYINKFYSRTIYEFDPFPDIIDNISIILNKIQINSHRKDLLNFNNISNLDVSFINHIIQELLIRRHINLRNLLKLLDKELPIRSRRLNLPGAGDRLTNFHFYIIICFDFIIALLGEPRSLEKALLAISEYSEFRIKSDEKFYLLQQLMGLLDYKQHLFSQKSEISVFKFDDQEFHYNLLINQNVWARICDDKGEAIDPLVILNQINSLNINRLIYNAYLICKDLGIYK